MNNSLPAEASRLESAEDVPVEEKPEQGLELHVGSNVFRTTNGVVKLQGKEQLVLEIRDDPPALLLTMDIYDEQGRRIGHLRRNAFSTGAPTRFAVTTTTGQGPSPDGHGLALSDRLTGRTLIEVSAFQKRKIRISCGQFFTHKGELVTISPHYCRIGTGLTRFGDVTESRGGPAIIA